MTTRAELTALAERIRTSTDPARYMDGSITKVYRVLDADIARATGFGLVAQEWQYEKLEWYAWVDTQRWGPWEVLKHYTTDINHAMKLVPEGTGIHINRYWNREGEAWSTSISFGGLPDDPRRVYECFDAVSAALAITATALIARAGELPLTLEGEVP